MTVTAMAPERSVADASANQAERPLDLVHLSKYTLGNRNLEAELLGLFRAQAGIYLARLQDAANEKEWKDVTHSLKGSARSIGAWALGDLAEEAEARAAEDAAGRAGMIGRLRDAIDTVNLYIDELMD